MEIRRYNKERDEDKLMQLLIDEGTDWSCYWADGYSDKYKAALQNSITYVAYEGDVLCGFSRSIDDCGFYTYVCDLLVDKKHRGKNIGRQLMQCIIKTTPTALSMSCPTWTAITKNRALCVKALSLK